MYGCYLIHKAGHKVFLRKQLTCFLVRRRFLFRADFSGATQLLVCIRLHEVFFSDISVAFTVVVCLNGSLPHLSVKQAIPTVKLYAEGFYY